MDLPGIAKKIVENVNVTEVKSNVISLQTLTNVNKTSP